MLSFNVLGTNFCFHCFPSPMFSFLFNHNTLSKLEYIQTTNMHYLLEQKNKLILLKNGFKHVTCIICYNIQSNIRATSIKEGIRVTITTKEGTTMGSHGGLLQGHPINNHSTILNNIHLNKTVLIS